MARPPSSRTRRGRERDEEDDGGRRSRYAPPPRKGPQPAVLLLGGAVIVVFVIIGVVLAGGGDRKAPPPPPAPPPLKAKTVEPPRPVEPSRPQPKPLTEQEKAYLEGLFTQAKPHIEEFRRKAREGWDLKGRQDNDGANECWIDAKHAFQKAVQIVSEGLEDETRFEPDRPGLDRFNERLAVWQKEMSELPKVNVTR